MLKDALGFTLVEIVVAIALVSVLAGVAAPYITTWLRNHDLTSFVDTLAAQFFASSIRSKSLNKTVFFGKSGSDFEFRSDQGLKDCNSEAFTNAVLDEHINLNRRLAVTVEAPVSGVICFFPNGRSSGGSIKVSTGSLIYDVSINSLSGIVTVGK